MPKPDIPTTRSGRNNPINVHCLDATGRPRVTQVFWDAGRLVINQPPPGGATYDLHQASELGTAVEQVRQAQFGRSGKQ
ncbi:hypothetical protein F4560_003662 [Saccharothrix ecbatanensis]|uniref:Uncharacterized protein n=1 Tax=Saccharothrix ecbatanensis TaxID=1105145 RepID=A0A7W9M1F0_9PSEU|nr:hypothetical protein [Saccharothrix ecbatanensis]MBB5803894.1 hypothetical protein [Saccharothrix ecbatanensis]